MDTYGRPGYPRIAGGDLNFSVFAILSLFFVLITRANAQTSTADMLGTVTGPTGATVSNATVTPVIMDTDYSCAIRTDIVHALSVEMAKHNHALISS
jgi:hypothetical protein